MGEREWVEGEGIGRERVDSSEQRSKNWWMLTGRKEGKKKGREK